MKPFLVIGRGRRFPLIFRVFRRRGTVETLASRSLYLREWSRFGFMILNNF